MKQKHSSERRSSLTFGPGLGITSSRAPSRCTSGEESSRAVAIGDSDEKDCSSEVEEEVRFHVSLSNDLLFLMAMRGSGTRRCPQIRLAAVMPMA